MRSPETKGSSRLAALALLSALALGLGLGGLAPPAAAAVAVSRITITNVTDTSITISWVTNTPSGGYVKYGDSRPTDQTSSSLVNTAQDVRGQDYAGYTHYVTLSSLLAGTTYYYSVTSGDTTVSRDSQGPLNVRTGPTPNIQPPAPNDFAGLVYKSDGVTPADGVVVYLYLQHTPSSGSAVSSARMSALTDDGGRFTVDVSQARVPVGPSTGAGTPTATPVPSTREPYFDFSLSGDKVFYYADAGPGNLVSTQSVDTSTLSQGSAPGEVEIQLPNPDPATPTPTVAAASGTATPTRTPAGSRSSSPTRTPVATATRTAAVQPTAVAPTATPTAAPPPKAAATEGVAPSPTPTATLPPTSTPTSTPMPGFLRPPPPVTGARPLGSTPSGYPKQSQAPIGSPSPRPVQTSVAPTATGPASTAIAEQSTSSVVGAIVLLGAVLLASGLGLVTVGVVSSLRRRSA